ncbi:MAG: methyltransferase domain-containing protein [Planctomycetales bacterium]
MHWKTRALIQNVVSLLPDSLSYPSYYFIQRNFGRLRRLSPVERYEAGVKIWKRLLDVNYNPVGKVFFEVGTGRVPTVPLSFWLMGAERTVTVDLNPYLRPELIREQIAYTAEHQDEIRGIFGSYLIEDRLQTLVGLSADKNLPLEKFLKTCGIEYLAPADAAKTSLPAGSIDVHMSFTVFEHIPREILEAILKEGSRIVRPDGVFIHYIDYSDHFSHTDKSISPINFLQFPDDQWARLSGNRYMYVNRLRHDDFLKLYDDVGHKVLACEPIVNPEVSKLLQSGKVLLNARFARKTPEVLATTKSWVLSQSVGC